MLKFNSLLLVMTLLAGAAASGASVTVSGMVTGEDGAALQALHVQVGATIIAVDESGRFAFTFGCDTQDPVLLRVSAEGYYPAVQAVHATDFTNRTTIPPIELVRRQAGRSLLLFAGDAIH